MAVGTFTVYGEAKEAMAKADLDLDGSACAVLLTSGYTPDNGTDATYGDISANVVTDGDYSPQDVTGVVVGDTGAGFSYDTNDVSFGASVTITAKYLVLVSSTVAGLAAGSRLIGYVDLDTSGSASSSAAQFNVTAPAGGWFTVD